MSNKRLAKRKCCGAMPRGNCETELMNTILVPLDFSPVSSSVVAQAARLAKRLGLPVVLFHAIPPPVIVAEYGAVLTDITPLSQSAIAGSKRRLGKLAEKLGRQGVRAKTRVTEGHPATEILAAAKSIKPAYIVIGSHGHTAFYDLVVGSAAHAVLQRATCPVVVVPAKGKR